MKDRTQSNRTGEERRKTDESLVILDNPDDGEIADTGDASDFAGEKKKSTKHPAQRTDKGGRGPKR